MKSHQISNIIKELINYTQETIRLYENSETSQDHYHTFSWLKLMLDRTYLRLEYLLEIFILRLNKVQVKLIQKILRSIYDHLDDLRCNKLISDLFRWKKHYEIMLFEHVL